MAEEITEQEAKFFRDKFVLEQTPELINDEISKNTAVQFLKVDPENYDKIKGKQQSDIEKEKEDELRFLLNACYNNIIHLLKEYCDLKEEYYSIISLWIIGTYLHDNFSTFPYLYINATKGSGKTRLLKLIAALSRNGKLVGSLKESVLFRTAKNRTLCIDEFESIGNKENQALRELLNACYKKGITIERMKKVRTFNGEEYQVEEFEPYTPICMANINGMNDVLGDRSLSLILEKSDNNRVTREIEDFENNVVVKDIKNRLNEVLVQLCSVVLQKNTILDWNNYIKERYRYTNYIYTYNTVTTQTTEETSFKVNQNINLLEFFNKIHDTNINGRHLELFFPFFIIANFLNKELLDQTLNFAMQMTNERNTEDVLESLDTILLDFIAKQEQTINFISIQDLLIGFKEFIGGLDVNDKDINAKWIGKSLKRLGLIVDKKRVSKGIEVILAVAKAKTKLEVYKKQ